MRFRGIGITLLLLALWVAGAEAQSGYFSINQSIQLAGEEAETVYRTNLARQANGLPPLRWNAQLTQASRWFAYDSVENRPTSYCGHQDTLGAWPDSRASAFGYLGLAGAENAFCGYITPQQAVDGWMGSDGHSDNILDPNSREIGLGYYRRDSDGRGFVVQDFGNDPAYAPLVINNEALNTTNPQVNLYFYNSENSGGVTGRRMATAMQISNDACFTEAAWQPFQSNQVWSLPGGEGWKTVYARARDLYGYISSAEDVIYLGGNPPLAEISTAQMSSASPVVTLYDLDSGGRNSIQFSLGWLTDQFKRPSDNQMFSQVSDPQALDGKALLLSPTDDNAIAWDWTTRFPTNTPMVAYFRLKVNNNSSNAEVAQLQITAGTNTFSPVSIKGTHFKAANQYQEFAVPFTFTPDEGHPFLIFNIRRTASVDLSIDVITIFTAPQPFTGETMTISVPGGNYRGQGVWVRYLDSDLSNFTPFTNAVTVKPELRISQPGMTFLAGLAADDPSPPPGQIDVQTICSASFTWQVSDNAAWLDTERIGSSVVVRVSARGMAPGNYQAAVTFTPSDEAIASVQMPVDFIVVPDLKSLYLPGVRR